MLGSIDPFIIFEIGGQEITTELIKNNNAPIWETNLYVSNLHKLASCNEPMSI